MSLSMRTKRSKILSLALVLVMLVVFCAPLGAVRANAASSAEYTTSGNRIQNEYMVYQQNSTRYALHTTGGDPNSSSDNNARLLYGDISSGTSDVILNIAGAAVAYSPAATYVNSDATALYSYMNYGSVLIEQYVTLAYNTATLRNDTVEMKYVITNNGSTSTTGGARIFFDTMLGSNDSAPFKIPGVGDLTTQREFTGANIPQTWQVFDNLSNPSVIASGTFYTNEANRPDKVQFINYGNGSSDVWDCYVSTGNSIGDSAVNIYFNPITLAPGESRTVKTCYGISAFVPQCDHVDSNSDYVCDSCGENLPRPGFVDFNMSAVVPQALLVDTDTNTYDGNPFTLNAWISNVGGVTANNVTARIVLPAGLSIIGQSDTINIGTLYTGNNTNVSWSITAADHYAATTLNYKVIVSDGETEETYNYSINIPALEMPVCDHTETDWILDCEPGCTTPGVSHTECTTCGEVVRTNYTAALGHTYEITSEIPATCTENGAIVMTCLTCGSVRNQIIYADGHIFGDDNVCDTCGFVAESHEHDYTVSYVNATCTTIGYTVHTCVCGYSYRSDILDQLGHRWDAGVVTAPATCTTNGAKTYTCTECGVTHTEVLAAAHSFVEAITTPKTCTTDGLKTLTCTACGEVQTEVIPAGHDWNEGTVLTPAACTTEGAKECTCLTCGVTEILVIPVLGHEFRDGRCVRCGATIPDVVTPEPDHLEYGMYFEIDDIISNYGPDLINEYGVLLDYNEGATIKKVGVFLTQDGTMWRRCIAVVGEGITYATYVPYLSYGSDIKYTGLNSDWINIFRLSENSSGIWCYSNYATIGVNLQDRNGNLLLSLYDIGQAGAKTRVFDNLDEMIAWLMDGDGCVNHVGESVTVAPTCTTEGYTLITCEVCGQQVRERIVPSLGHVESEWKYAAPSVSSTGLNYTECTVCGEILQREIIPILSAIDVADVIAGAGAIVGVNVYIENNPGIAAAILTVNYNSALTLVGASVGGAWTTLYLTQPGEFVNYCRFVFDGMSNDYSNGTVLTLYFQVPADVAIGNRYEITVSYGDGELINELGQNVYVNTIGGSITVEELVGDVNGDGVVDVADVVALRRYLSSGYDVAINLEQADVNADGSVTVADILALRQLLVGAL